MERKMKMIWILVAGLLLAGCAGTGSHSVLPASKNVVDLQEQEEEYDIIIDDPGFSTWMITNSRPIWYYSPQYYHQKNVLYVSDWNAKVASFRGRGPFVQQINYDPSIDYGVKVDHQLFWYFKYIHKLYGGRYTFPS